MVTVTLCMTLQNQQWNRIYRRNLPPCWRVKGAVDRIWRKFIADENPDEKQRKRQKQIDNIMHNVVLMEAMRRWELESKAHEVSKDGHIAEE